MLSVCAEATMINAIGWYNWDVTNHVKDAIRLGLPNVDLLIKYAISNYGSVSNSMAFRYRSYTSDQPKLVIDGVQKSAIKNASVLQSLPTANLGNSDLYINTQVNKNKHIFISFPLDDITEVTSATLSLYAYDIDYVQDMIVQACKLTRSDWVETEATWNIYKKGSNWTTAGGDYVAEVDDLPTSSYTYTYGSGTEADPYQVWTADDLNGVRDYLSAYFIQMDNVDLISYSNWTPIGDLTTPFAGNYNGNSKLIDGLTIDLSVEGTDNVGLFGYVDGATIQKLGVINANVVADRKVGALAGYIINTTITNCFSTGTVTGSQFIGGLVGTNYTSSTISNCYSMVSVSGDSFIGGLVGYCYGSTIDSAFSTGSVVSVDPEYCGGLMGDKYSYSGITNSYYNSETSGMSDTGKGIPKTTAEMSTQSTFTGWNFTSTWSIHRLLNNGYPYLTWQSLESSTYLYDYGMGTSADPFQIWDIDDLNGIRYYLSSIFIQMADIDLDSVENWIPIGTPDTSFSGMYDGNDFKIENLTITSISNNIAGLFSIVEDAQFSNVTIENLSISCGVVIGGLTAFASGSYFSNCKTTGTITTDDELDGEITGIGGLIGVNNDCILLENCFADVDINVTGILETTITVAGGLIGENSLANELEISQCCAYGDVTVTVAGMLGIGGLIGHGSSQSLNNIKDCYAKGSITGSSPIVYIGGFSGICETETIINCFSCGQVNVSGAEIYSGGLLGFAGGTVTDSYYDATVSGQSDTGKGEPLTTTQMKNQLNYNSWNFTTTWDIDSLLNDGYPYLLWQDLEPLAPSIIDGQVTFTGQADLNFIGGFLYSGQVTFTGQIDIFLTPTITIDRIRGAFISPILQYQNKIEWLDWNTESPIADYTSDAIDGSISVDKSNNIRRTFTLSVNNSNGLYVPNGARTNMGVKVRLKRGINTPTGITWYDRGVFVLSDPTSSHQGAQKLVDLQGVDKWALLDGSLGGTLASTTVIPNGTSISEAIRAVVEDATGETKFAFDVCDVTTPYTITKEAGETVADLILELALIPSWELFYDVNGYLRFRPMIDPLQKQIVVDLSQDGIYRSLYIGGEYSPEWSKIKNSWKVLGYSDPDTGIIYDGTAQDNNPYSPTNTALPPYGIGEKLKVMTDSNLRSDDLCSQRAAYELRANLTKIDRSQHYIIPIPYLLEGDCVQLEDVSNGIPKDKYEIQAFTEPLGLGLMQIEAWRTSMVFEIIAFDDFQTGLNQWQQLGSGIIDVTGFEGNNCLRKTTNADPNGGYKLLSKNCTDFELVVYTRRDVAGLGTNSYAVVNSVGTGYGISLDYSNNILTLDERITWTRSTLDSVEVTPEFEEWYTLRLTKLGSNFMAEIYEGKTLLFGNPLASVGALDTTTTSFDREAVLGGNVFYSDDIQVRKLL
jgi:hypothetical protein